MQKLQVTLKLTDRLLYSLGLSVLIIILVIASPHFFKILQFRVDTNLNWENHQDVLKQYTKWTDYSYSRKELSEKEKSKLFKDLKQVPLKSFILQCPFDRENHFVESSLYTEGEITSYNRSYFRPGLVEYLEIVWIRIKVWPRIMLEAFTYHWMSSLLIFALSFTLIYYRHLYAIKLKYSTWKENNPSGTKNAVDLPAEKN